MNRQGGADGRHSYTTRSIRKVIDGALIANLVKNGLDTAVIDGDPTDKTRAIAIEKAFRS